MVDHNLRSVHRKLTFLSVHSFSVSKLNNMGNRNKTFTKNIPYHRWKKRQNFQLSKCEVKPHLSYRSRDNTGRFYAISNGLLKIKKMAKTKENNLPPINQSYQNPFTDIIM